VTKESDMWRGIDIGFICNRSPGGVPRYSLSFQYAKVCYRITSFRPRVAPANDYAARVIGIADGDTITVLTADKTQHRIRLNGIDAPETGQDFGSRAKQAASELSFGGGRRGHS
jgi:endonuclease YncB( thermonuclease family)